MTKHILIFIFSLFIIGGCNAQSYELSIDSVWQEVALEDVVVTAQYAPTHSKNAVHQVKVIKASEIQAQGYNNLAEVLTNQINLRVTNDLVLGNGLKIQGIGGENVQVMIDGVPVIGRLSGNIDLSQIQLTNIEQIEIAEGAMSAQYGNNTAGGVINIITKKSQVERLKIESKNQYEDIGIWNNAISISGRLDKLYATASLSRINSQFGSIDSLRVYEERETADGESYQAKVIPWNPKEQWAWQGKLRYSFSDSLNVSYAYN